MKIVLVTPPILQLNTPYSACPQLAGFLKSRGHEVVQVDASLEFALRIFNRRFLASLSATRKYASTIDSVIKFLQGKDDALAKKICTRRYLPEGPRFAVLSELRSVSGNDKPLNILFDDNQLDKAKYIASLYIDDLADIICAKVDQKFQLSRYAEKLAVSAPAFKPIKKMLDAKPTVLDRIIDEIAADSILCHNPDIVGFTIPFPGNLYAALRMALKVKKESTCIKTVFGGGYVNTELRNLSDPGVFDYVDYVVLDDGERPLLALIEHLSGNRHQQGLCRTFVRQNRKVHFMDGCREKDVKRAEIPAPVYDGLKLRDYISICETPNPMHRMWSDGHWNKLMLAHGCYWNKCAFCDVSLDYICRYDADTPERLVDRMESMIKATGSRKFHFVDEAVSPALLRSVAQEIIRREIKIEWWANIRFEKAFTEDAARLLAKSGCVAVSGGLETACDRTLKLMEKGITVGQARNVAANFWAAGILVHSYLIYGFPSQTEEETRSSLEVVRDLFDRGYIQSAYWHRFALTVHSPMARNPAKYGIKIRKQKYDGFAKNELAFEDKVKCEYDALGRGLKSAVYNYMLGIGLDYDVDFWFE